MLQGDAKIRTMFSRFSMTKVQAIVFTHIGLLPETELHLVGGWGVVGGDICFAGMEHWQRENGYR